MADPLLLSLAINAQLGTLYGSQRPLDSFLPAFCVTAERTMIVALEQCAGFNIVTAMLSAKMLDNPGFRSDPAERA